jgi:ubiquitin-like modifier-activating enzyme ATG7
MTILQFQSFASSISPEFWQQLSKLKLDKLQLSTEQISVHATYSVGQQAKMIDDQQVGGIARLVFDQVDPTDTYMDFIPPDLT